jgi:HSP20 family protein
MSSLRQNLNRTWAQVQAGWNNLVSNASNALTHFVHKGGENAVDVNELLRSTPEWGLLAAELHESGEQVTVRLEVPGMDSDKFDVKVIDRTLIVSGHKQVESERKEGRYHITECAYGEFERSLPLPVEVDSSKAEASYRNGVLTLTLPKTEREKVRRIPINSA